MGVALVSDLREQIIRNRSSNEKILYSMTHFFSRKKLFIDNMDITFSEIKNLNDSVQFISIDVGRKIFDQMKKFVTVFNYYRNKIDSEFENTFEKNNIHISLILDKIDNLRSELSAIESRIVLLNDQFASQLERIEQKKFKESVQEHLDLDSGIQTVSPAPGGQENHDEQTNSSDDNEFVHVHVDLPPISDLDGTWVC